MLPTGETVLQRFALDGRAVVVTGGGRGLGRGMALALAEAGASVLVAARTEEQLLGVVEEIRAAGGTASHFVCDATRSEQVDALVQACVDRYGAIDAMFANAGGGQGPDAEFWEFPDDGFEAVMAQNLKSVFYAARAASAQMIRQERPGVIVPTASGSALRGRLPFAYPTAKGGVLSLTRSMAARLAAFNIRVNTIVPGYVSQRPPKDAQEEAVRAQRGSFIPVGRLGEWWELGPLAIFLASDASSYITGAQFIIDGGGLSAGLGPVGFPPAAGGLAMPPTRYFDLTGKKAMVIGADNPAGGAIARAYAQAGADVALCALTPDEAVMRARAVRRDIEALGRRAPEYIMDVTLGRNVQVTTRQAVKDLGGIDILAVAPDLFLAKPIESITDTDLARVMQVNFNAHFFAVRTVAQEFRRQGRPGRVVLVTSVLGERGLPNTTAYAAAHGAVHNLVRAAAEELARDQVMVNGIALGWMDWMDDRLDPEDEEAQRAVRFTAMRRRGRADEVGPLALYLSSEVASGYVTGQIFPVDGGLLLHL